MSTKCQRRGVRGPMYSMYYKSGNLNDAPCMSTLAEMSAEIRGALKINPFMKLLYFYIGGIA